MMFAELQAGDVHGHGINDARHSGHWKGSGDDHRRGGGSRGVAGGETLVFGIERVRAVKAIGQVGLGPGASSAAAENIGDEAGDAGGKDAGDTDLAPTHAVFGHAQKPYRKGQRYGEHDIGMVTDELGDSAGSAFFQAHFFDDCVIGLAEHQNKNGPDTDRDTNDPKARPEASPAAAKHAKKFAGKKFPAQTGGAFLFGRFQGE